MSCFKLSLFFCRNLHPPSHTHPQTHFMLSLPHSLTHKLTSCSPSHSRLSQHTASEVWTVLSSGGPSFIWGAVETYMMEDRQKETRDSLIRMWIQIHGLFAFCLLLFSIWSAWLICLSVQSFHYSFSTTTTVIVIVIITVTEPNKLENK